MDKKTKNEMSETKDQIELCYRSLRSLDDCAQCVRNLGYSFSTIGNEATDEILQGIANAITENTKKIRKAILENAKEECEISGEHLAQTVRLIFQEMDSTKIVK